MVFKMTANLDYVVAFQQGALFVEFVRKVYSEGRSASRLKLLHLLGKKLFGLASVSNLCLHSHKSMNFLKFVFFATVLATISLKSTIATSDRELCTCVALFFSLMICAADTHGPDDNHCSLLAAMEARVCELSTELFCVDA